MEKSFEKNFDDLLSRKLAGEADAKDLKRLEQMLAENSVLQFLHDQLLKSGSDHLNNDNTDAAYAVHHLKIIQATTTKGNRNSIVNDNTIKWRKKLLFLGIAACLLIVWRILTLPVLSDAESLKEISVTTVERGGKYRLHLPDGTIVYLNKNSSIIYASDFGKFTRTVSLKGEAHFQVAHKKKIPFVVNTSQGSIKVLGTVFNIRDYENEDKMETSLIEGSIELHLTKANNSVVKMNPSEKLIIEKTQKITSKKRGYTLTHIDITDSVVAETSWINNKIVFANKPFLEIASEMEHRFGVTIVFENEKIKTNKYTGVFEEDGIDDILEILQIIKPFKFRRVNDKIVIY